MLTMMNVVFIHFQDWCECYIHVIVDVRTSSKMNLQDPLDWLFLVKSYSYLTTHRLYFLSYAYSPLETNKFMFISPPYTTCSIYTLLLEK